MSMIMGHTARHDPRVTLATQKYFSMRPKPLERWLWRQGLPQAVERVYWYHWELGAQHQTWCSQVPIKVVARDCCVDPSTVTRAYQVLKGLQLIRREEPPRDPRDPFRQLVALTEVLIPRELVQSLAREPNRPSRSARSAGHAAGHVIHPHVGEPQDSPGGCAVARTPPPPAGLTAARSDMPVATQLSANTGPRLSRHESQRILAKLSDAERARFYQASQGQSERFDFDPRSALDEHEKTFVLNTLQATIRAAAAAKTPVSTQVEGSKVGPTRPHQKQRLSLLEQVRVRRELLAAIPRDRRSEAAVADVMRQILWSVEEGTLARFPASHAVNIALKKVRDGQWQPPYRMPQNWGRHRATPETCTDAGV